MPHKCGSTKHRIISPKLDPRPGPYPALTEVQNITEPEPPRRDPKPPRLPPADPPPELPTPLPLPPAGLPVLVMASLEKPPPPAPAPAPAPLALTPSQHLVAGGGEARGLLPGTDAAMETGEPAPTFDPDCFLNCPARGQTYGCQPPLEPPVGGNRFFIQDDRQPPGEGGLPPVPPGPDKPPGGLQEELYTLMRPGTAPPFGLAFDSLISELLTDEGAPPGEPPPPTGPCTPEPGDASQPNTLVTITDFSPEWSYPEVGGGPRNPPCPGRCGRAWGIVCKWGLLCRHDTLAGGIWGVGGIWGTGVGVGDPLLGDIWGMGGMSGIWDGGYEGEFGVLRCLGDPLLGGIWGTGGL